MRWLRGLAILVVGLSMVQFGCGSDSFGGTDQGTLNLQSFGDGAEDQPDSVGATSAQIDVCQNLCSSGEGEITFEPFSSTIAAAFVINEGKSDIVVQSIRVSYPNSGLTDINTAVGGGFVVPGRRCVNNPTQRCADDFECAGSFCVSSQTAIPFTLFDLTRKDLVGGDSCELIGFEPGVIPTTVTIFGRDADGEDYTLNGGLNLETANFDNCEDQ